MKIKLLLLPIILCCLAISGFAEEERLELKGGQMIGPEMLEKIKDLVEGVPIQDQELREIRDAANVWKRDSANTQIELRDAKALDMQSQQIDNVLDPTADQDAATKKYVDDNEDAGLWETDGGDAELKTADDIDAQNMQIKGMCIENRTDDTGCTQTGRIWFRTDL